LSSPDGTTTFNLLGAMISREAGGQLLIQRYFLVFFSVWLMCVSSMAFHETHAQEHGGTEGQGVEQRISLRAGWNMVSLSVMPEDNALGNVLAEVQEDIVLVRDQAGRVYSDVYGVYGFNEWKESESYQLYSKRPVTLVVRGTPLRAEDVAIEIEKGWNAVPFILSEQMPVRDAFESILSILVLATDDEGAVFLGEELRAATTDSREQTADLLPGRGYRVFASGSGRLIYPAQSTDGDEKPAPSDDDPAPSDDDPAPGDDDPAPSDDDPAPSDDDPAPGDDDPAPGDDESTPGDDEPSDTSPQEYLVPASIDPTGQRDVTLDLTDFIASVPDGSRIVFPDLAKYNIEGTILIKERKDLTIEGNGSTFYADDPRPEAYAVLRSGAIFPYSWGNRAQWRIEDSDNIVLRDLNIRGANAAAGTEREAYVTELEWQHGVAIRGARNVTIERVNIENVYGDFVYVGPGPKRSLSSGVVVRDGVMSGTGRMGIAVTHGEDVLIEANSLTGVRWSHIDLEPDVASDIVRRITIRNNIFNDARHFWIAAEGAPGLIEDVLIEDNRINRRGNLLVRNVHTDDSSLRRNFVLRRNDSSGHVASGSQALGAWTVENADGFVAEDNVIPVHIRSSGPGLLLRNVSNVHAQEGQWPGAPTQILVVND
jgi:hypothetical protein